MRYLSKRNYVWSADTAYGVGLIASDGCLQRNGRHVDLTSKDFEQLLNFSKALGRDMKIGRKTSGSGKFGYRIQFSDVAYYDFLLAAGLTPAKSKTLGPLTIPDEFYADFLRGLFDGDGSTYGYMDPRWRSSFMFYILFVSASQLFIEYIRQTNVRLVNGLTRGAIHDAHGVISLSYAKADSHRLFQFMYYNDSCLSLTRKKLKLLSFIRKDHAGIITRS
jgi:hypothetical protein